MNTLLKDYKYLLAVPVLFSVILIGLSVVTILGYCVKGLDKAEEYAITK